MTARKVLIVEDDAALLRGLKDNFRAQGYQVRTASDGEKGLEALLRDPPDLVLLDVMLPKVNGYEVCRLARSRRLQHADPDAVGQVPSGRSRSRLGRGRR